MTNTEDYGDGEGLMRGEVRGGIGRIGSCDERGWGCPDRGEASDREL